MIFNILNNEDANKVLNKTKVTAINIHFGQNAVTSLSDDYFLDFPNIVSLSLSLTTNGINLPSSLSNLKKVSNLEFYEIKAIQLPDFIFDLPLIERFWLSPDSQPSLDWSKELPRLATLLNLKSMRFYAVKSKYFLEKLPLLQQIESIFFNRDFIKKFKNTDIIAALSSMKNLKKVEFDYNFELCDALLQLDFLETISHHKFRKAVDAPLFLSLFKNAKLTFNDCSEDEKVNETMISHFQKNIVKPDFDDTQRQMMFTFWNKNMKNLQDVILQTFGIQSFTNKKIATLGIIKREVAETIKTYLPELQCEIVNPKKQNPDFYVVFSQVKYEDFEMLVSEKIPFVLEDDLMNLLKEKQEHYLLEEDNTELNVELIRLLVSNQNENLLIAFSIIESGGADKTVQSLLAAIYLAHPDKAIQKAVTKLYEKYCSAVYRTYAKQGKASLRISNNAHSGTHFYSVHDDINRFDFILMYQKIAGDNPRVKDYALNQVSFADCDLHVLPEIITSFSMINHLNLSNNPNIDLLESKKKLETLSALNTLILKNCKTEVPDLSTLKSLKNLNLSFNTLQNSNWIGHLNLASLEVESCQIQDWSFLKTLSMLETLDITKNGLTELPSAINDFSRLKQLKARRNNIIAIDEKFNQHQSLILLDLGYNNISGFLSQLLDIFEVTLNNNNITVIDFTNQSNDKIYQIVKLNVSKNKLESFKIGSLNLSNLKELFLSENELTSLDDALFQTADLTVLDASKNKITVIPDSITIHPEYRRILLKDNKISALTKILLDLILDYGLDLKNNPITSIAEEIIEYKKIYHSHIHY